MSKIIQFGDEARTNIFEGIEAVAKSVTITMGPKGRNVILEKAYGAPQVTNDGVTIAREIQLEDKFQNMGANLVKEAAEKTNSIAGDGTTTATLLTYALAKEGLRYIKSGVNAVELKNGMKKATQQVVDYLGEYSKSITSKEEIAQVATISAQDSVVGEIIAEAMDKVGNNGVISVEEGHSFGLEVEITEGMEFDQGYLSPYMVDNAEKMTAEVKNTPILITNQKISNVKDLLPILEQLVQDGKKDLVIIAEDIDGEALTAIILNKLKGALNILGIKSPGFGDKKNEILKDIAVLTKATVVTSELGMKLEHIDTSVLGSAKHVLSSQDKTMIIGGAGDRQDIELRVGEIKNEINGSKNQFEKEKLIERLAKLDGGVAVIKVGAASEIEMKEKKLRIEDALNATRAAVSEGVVAGGGVALLRSSKVLEGLDFKNEDQNIGLNIVKQALSYPIKQIVENSGKEGAIVINKIQEESSDFYGYDAATDKYVDMIKNGIIDPKKVERVALQEAVSLAGMFLTTESAIVSKESPTIPAMPAPQMPMGGMGGIPMM